ncbi:MAG: sulfur carrier protein [Microbacteriaceae bacterium]|jgi:sulfur carrier protein|nr:thiamine biosynthesis protein ThiS [Microbacteriaceae bacterium]MDQ1527088.1 sulfur carrier protein [Microbacteriaceae bacterium]MDQ1577627.1 sulfur carrier protein [Microbacteriaceae bacterium]
MTETRSAGITVNGSTRPLARDETITDLVSEVTGRPIAGDGRATDGRRLGVAVARNSEVVPRSRWAETVLTSGDDIEIVTAVQGG